MSTLKPQTVVAGRYTVEKLVAEGGQGSVYAVVDKTGRRRAMKVLHGLLRGDPDLVARFEREATVTSKIESDHIVDILDAGRCPDTEVAFIVMEYLRGETLESRISARGPLDGATAAEVARQLAIALDAAHAHGIIHRDVKLENVFLEQRATGSLPPGAPTFRVKLLDFGVAKAVSTFASRQTRTVGTAGFMAPEQIQLGGGGPPLSPATDVYALGHVVFATLVGATIFQIEGLESLEQAIAFALTRRAIDGDALAAKRGVTLPGGVSAWLARATAFEASERFPSAREAVAALRPLLGDGRASLPGVASGSIATLPTAFASPASSGAPTTPEPTRRSAPGETPGDKPVTVFSAPVEAVLAASSASAAHTSGTQVSAGATHVSVSMPSVASLDAVSLDARRPSIPEPPARAASRGAKGGAGKPVAVAAVVAAVAAAGFFVIRGLDSGASGSAVSTASAESPASASTPSAASPPSTGEAPGKAPGEAPEETQGATPHAAGSQAAAGSEAASEAAAASVAPSAAPAPSASSSPSAVPVAPKPRRPQSQGVF